MTWVISQNIAVRAHIITSVLNNFKSLIKEVYQKGHTQKFKKKKEHKIATLH